MNLFKPRLTIQLDASLKTYSVLAELDAPTGCYIAAGSQLGLPPGQVATPESETVTLRIDRRGDFCTQAIKTLEYQVSGIPITEGKTTLVAFAVFGSEVLGVSSAAIPQFEAADRLAVTSEPSGASLVSLNGWIDAMPPGSPTLIAVLSLWAPCRNYDFEIERVGPFGVTGRTLLLRLHAQQPSTCLNAVFAGTERFQEKLESADRFDSVAVEFEGNITLDELEVVH